MTLSQLKPGDRFRVPSLDQTGTVEHVSECSVRVRLDGGKAVEFGGRVFFARCKSQTWCRSLSVVREA